MLLKFLFKKKYYLAVIQEASKHRAAPNNEENLKYFPMQAKKYRKAKDKGKKNKLLQACLSGVGHIFSEIKAMKYSTGQSQRLCTIFFYQQW